MFKDSLVPEYSDDVNDVMVRQLDENKPIVVFGCGAGGGGNNRIAFRKWEDG